MFIHYYFANANYLTITFSNYFRYPFIIANNYLSCLSISFINLFQLFNYDIKLTDEATSCVPFPR